jgi:hypothetical protein
MIADKIKRDIADEFANLYEELQIYLKPDFDISQTRQSLQTYIPKQIIHKAEILLDTLLNYLMKDAMERMNSADVTLQNAFFDANFRNRVHEWARQLENTLTLKPDIVKYTSDPRLKQGLIASGIIFVIGTSVTLTVAPIVVGGIITVLLSALAFKIAYDKSSPQARETIKSDIEQYIETSKTQVSEWLNRVGVAFENDFQSFCLANGFTPIVSQ